ncbi:hypothetical protein [Cytobacillus sp. Bac17]|nr:hypothetical protein [Cytobacillus sp. Bac17]
MIYTRVSIIGESVIFLSIKQSFGMFYGIRVEPRPHSSLLLG